MSLASEHNSIPGGQQRLLLLLLAAYERLQNRNIAAGLNDCLTREHTASVAVENQLASST